MRGHYEFQEDYESSYDSNAEDGDSVFGSFNPNFHAVKPIHKSKLLIAGFLDDQEREATEAREGSNADLLEAHPQLAN